MNILKLYVICFLCFILGTVFSANWCPLMGCATDYEAAWYKVWIVLAFFVFWPTFLIPDLKDKR